jgi:hypothetical protein
VRLLRSRLAARPNHRAELRRLARCSICGVAAERLRTSGWAFLPHLRTGRAAAFCRVCLGRNSAAHLREALESLLLAPA